MVSKRCQRFLRWINYPIRKIVRHDGSHLRLVFLAKIFSPRIERPLRLILRAFLTRVLLAVPNLVGQDSNLL